MRLLSYLSLALDKPAGTYIERSLANFRSALEEHPEDKVHLMHSILVFMFAKDPDEIISYAFELLELDEEMEYTVEIYFALARAYTTKNEINQAIDCYRKIIAIDPAMNEAIIKGTLYYNRKEFSKALECYQRANELSTDHSDGWIIESLGE